MPAEIVSTPPRGTRAAKRAGPPARDTGAPASQTGAMQPRELTPLELGRRIRMLRVSRGLTLKDLEERGGISATHVSEIERGKASPTVGALGRIARALGMRPASLVEPRVLPEVAVTGVNERSLRTVRWGDAALEPVASTTQGAMMSAHLLTLPIGREPALTHRHEGEEWALALSGVSEVRIEDQVFVLREGDSLHFRSHRTHSYSNLASTPAVLLVAARPRLAL